jgi:hypothetical protein
MQLQTLMDAPEEARNQKWESDFLNAFSEANIHLVFPDPKPGPDKWPYMMVQTTATQYPAEPVLKVLHWLHDKGIGMVVNANKKLPDYVFTYGMIWNFKETGQFISDFSSITDTKLEIDTSKNYYYGNPTKSFLPDYVRKILKDFFLQQGVIAPKILLLSKNEKDFDLCFSLESLGNPPPKEHGGILEAISWFLPSHYRLGLISEINLPKFQNI